MAVSAVTEWSDMKRAVIAKLRQQGVVLDERPGARFNYRGATEREADAMAQCVAEVLERLGWFGPESDPTEVLERRELFAGIAERAAPKRRPRASRRQVEPIDDRPELVAPSQGVDAPDAVARDERLVGAVRVVAADLDRVEEGAHLGASLAAGDAEGVVVRHGKTVARIPHTAQGVTS